MNREFLQKERKRFLFYKLMTAMTTTERKNMPTSSVSFKTHKMNLSNAPHPPGVAFYFYPKFEVGDVVWVYDAQRDPRKVIIQRVEFVFDDKLEPFCRYWSDNSGYPEASLDALSPSEKQAHHKAKEKERRLQELCDLQMALKSLLKYENYLPSHAEYIRKAGEELGKLRTFEEKA